MKCNSCGNEGDECEIISCSQCKETYHYLCCNLELPAAAERPAKIRAREKLWVCPACAMKSRKIVTDDTPASPSLQNRGRPEAGVQDTYNTNINPPSPTVGADLISEIRLFRSEFLDLRTQLEKTVSTLSQCNARLEELTSVVSTMDDRLSRLEAKERDVEVLQLSMSKLQDELDIHAQKLLGNELEISGVPEHKSENLYHTVMILGQKIGVNLDEHDVDWVSRVGPLKNNTENEAYKDRQFPRPVVIRLTRKNKRDQLLKAARLRRNLTSTDLEIQGHAQKLYFQERLTKLNRQLFRDTRAQAKRVNFKYIWTNNGRIYVRKSQGTAAINIRNQTDMERVLGSTLHLDASPPLSPSPPTPAQSGNV